MDLYYLLQNKKLPETKKEIRINLIFLIISSSFMIIFTVSNILSLLRGPLAFLFLWNDPFFRAFAVIAAMITDFLDGFIARRYGTCSQLGAFLDPLMDKFFVFFSLSVLMQQGHIELWQALALISRDFAVLVFGLYLALSKNWSNFQFRSIWCGKITTTFQFFVLLGLIFSVRIPSYIFLSFIGLGFFALIELYFIEQQILREKK